MKSIFGNIKIGTQLWIVIGLIFISFIVTGLWYGRILNHKAETDKQVQRMEKYKVMIDDANIDLLRAQRFEKDFLLTRDVGFLSRHREVLDTTNNDIDILEVAAPKALDRENVAKLGEMIDTYEDAFLKFAAIMLDLGLGADADSGKFVELRRKSEKIGQIIDRFGIAGLMGKYADLRTNEAMFMLDGKKSHLNRLINDFNKFFTLTKRTTMPEAARQVINAEVESYKTLLQEIPKEVTDMERERSRFTMAGKDAGPLFANLVDQVDKLIIDSKRQISAKTNNLNAWFVGILVGAAVWVGALLFLLRNVITRSLRRLFTTINAVKAGNFSARTAMEGGDELNQLGQVLDQMLDDRMAATRRIELENEKLNNSIIQLLETTSKLSENDLTVKAAVTEDVTGPVADAINQMVEETVQVLQQITSVAVDVQVAANRVKQQADKVVMVAGQERHLLDETLDKLSQSAEAIYEVSDLAQVCSGLANDATQSTNRAMISVNNTAQGMNDIRETISETEKRIKRLGERSQEITAVVDIINTIAERTHVLALNASMQAAAAGEAGRGFAVVADEVQRLAESSRNSTSQIATLVQSIQSETSEAMLTMNKTIDQVVTGTDLAGRAEKEMQQTQDNTENLAQAVHKIADRSLRQSELADKLRDEAKQIQSSTEITNKELKEQGAHTDSLVMYSRALSDTVNIFKLPAA